MDIIELARKLGTELQKDEKFIKLRLLEQNMENNSELQEMISKFNMDKMLLNSELSKENINQDKVDELNDSVMDQYDQIMNNEDMKQFNSAKQEIDILLKRVNAIIMKSAQGEDPMTADYEEMCGGSCSSCPGCH